MAYFSNERRDRVQLMMTDLMEKPEFRRSPSAALNLALMNRRNLVALNEEARALDSKRSDQQTVNLAIMNKQDFTVKSNREYNHSGAVNDSTNVDVSFITSAVDFKYSLKQYDRVNWDKDMGFARQLLSAFIKLHNKIDQDALDFMETNKSQVAKTSGYGDVGTWDGTNNIFQVAAGDYDLFLNNLDTFMQVNDYTYSDFQGIVSPSLYNKMKFLAQQGAGNEKNLGFQFDNWNLMMSNKLTIDSGYNGQGFILPAGSFSALNWIPSKNEEGYGDEEKIGGRYSMVEDPFETIDPLTEKPMKFAVHIRAEATDNEATYGETQDIDYHVEVSTDLGFFKALQSEANASPIFKMGVLK